MKRVVTTVVWALVLIGCAILGTGTVWWILSRGLFAPREPLSGGNTALHIAIAVAAAVAFFLRRDRLERAALGIAAIASGSTSVFGLGFTGPAVLAARLLSHVAAYAVWAFLAGRMLGATRRRDATGETVRAF